MFRVWGWNNKDINPSIMESCVHDLIQHQTEARSSFPAVSAWDGSLSYRELDIVATRLASYLVQLGVGPEVFVPVCQEKSKWAIVSILAIMKAGGAFVPMDAAQTGRFEAITRKSKATIVLASANSAKAISSLVGTVIVVDEELFTRIPSRVVMSSHPATSRNAAYVLFTSGSTGEPKGCIIEHGSWCASALGQKYAWGINHSSRALQFASFSFDASLGEMLTPLMFGGCVCIPSDSERLNDIGSFIRRQNVSFAILPPSFIKLLQPEDVPSLETIVLGGESTAKEDIQKWHDKVQFIPAYGPTECSLVSSSVTNVTIDTESSNIGVPNVANYWIVDPSNHNILMPVGATGELLIEGAIVGRGYVDNPSQTAAAFINNPRFVKVQPNEAPRRMYKTGDLVQYNTDGSFRYCGRIDTQIKLRGQRIELSEVEHHIRRAIGGGSEVAAEVLKFGNSKATLAAFISLGENFDGDETLRNISLATRNRLHALINGIDIKMAAFAPSYMIPSVFIPIKKLPLAPSLKVDRKKLRQMAASLSEAHIRFLSLSQSSEQRELTSMEERVRDLWATTLNIDSRKISLDDSFLKLGGDSILAIKLVAAFRAEKLSISVADVLRNLSLADTSAVVTSLDLPEQTEYLPFTTLDFQMNDDFLDEVICPQLSVYKSNIEDIVQGTSMQATFVKTGLLSTRGNTNYFVLSLSGSIDQSRLENACRELVLTHKILRTRFLVHHQQLLQVVLRTSPPEFRHYKAAKWRLGHLAAKLAKQDQTEPISLGDPIVRFMFLDGGKHNLLIMRLSHAQYDGMSIRILVDDLSALYGGENIPERPSFAEFVYSSQKSNARGGEEYWYSLLKGSAMTNVVLQNKPPYQNTKLKIVSRDVPSLSPQGHGMTFATVLKAAWALVLAQISGERDVVFGHLVSGRNLALANGDINDVLGPCLNIIPVRVQLEERITTAGDLLNNIHSQQLAAIPFETTGFDKIVQRCTDWPLWTRCSSVVQHQNLDGVEEHLESFKFGQHDCKFGALAPSHDSMDILVFSSPKGSKVRIDLQFCERVIPSFLAEDLMELLCINLRLLSTDMRKLLPPASLITSLPPQIPVDMKQTSPLLRSQSSNDKLSAFGKSSALTLSSNSRSSSISPIPSLFHKNNRAHGLVTRVWSSVLSTGDPESPFEIDTHTCFYDIWGNLLAAAQFSECFSQEGIDITMEEIIENPSIHMQTLLVGKKIAGQGSKRHWYKSTKPGKREGRNDAPRSAAERPLVRVPKFAKWRKNSGLRVAA